MIPQLTITRLGIVLVLALGLTLIACGGGAGKEDEAGALGVQSTWLPAGTSGSFYSGNLYASGGAGAGYTWALVLGSLPPGIEGLPATGSQVQLSGTPTADGTYDFTVRLADAQSDATDVPLRIVIGAGGGGGGGAGTSTATSTIGAPVGRVAHTAIWTGTEMIIWGGYNRLGLLNTGAAYRPGTDTWRALSTVAAPTGRQSHTAVWSGSEMIVFGGYDASGIVGTGGAYNPTSNTWRPLPATGAPQARSLHSAVWTGSRMIVWGGQGVFPPPRPNSIDLVFRDGFAYDPAGHTWSPTALSPTVGRSHVAAWTGSRMIVWGGRDSFALSVSTMSAGGIYDPGANTWTATPAAAAPAGRIGHTAVWSGAAFIVWGGTTDSLDRLNTGGRLTPGSSIWQATNLFGAPVGRGYHTAVWSGSEMLIWGGRVNLGGGSLAGGAYRPDTDAWRPLPAALDPTPRYAHTAVWTGAAMIIWGGAPGNPADVYLRTGTIIRP